ncbi:MAG: UDP-N-acetylglucosamine 4,6-dehydratase family protein, partial [Spirochaetia bacterium]
KSMRFESFVALRYLRGKRVLVTGAGGSIGSELCRQLLSGGADRLYLFGHGENSIYEIDRELRLLQEEGVGEKATIVPIIGEIQDADYMHFLLKRLRADVVLHTAAYKHVPLMEENPVAVVRNNVFGTHNLVQAAIQAGVDRFVFISTDKVVDPVSVYGASKRIAEEIVLNAGAGSASPKSNAGRSGAKAGNFMVVRFGNVLSSRGSIVPLFQRQIARGGPVTVTHPDMKRYYMTIPEASSLVLQTGGVGQAGGLYLLDMGEPLLIRELAEQLITFSGLTPYEDIDITYIGLRPGEKLSESLLSDDEECRNSPYERIMRINRERWPQERMATLLRRLGPVVFFDPEKPDLFRARRTLREILSEYVPSLPIPEYEPQY